GDSRNFSICGRMSSATCLSSREPSISRIFSAITRVISSRAETAEAVIVSGRSSPRRTPPRSVPQARQYWLTCRSSEPQVGQYIVQGYTGCSDAKFLVSAKETQEVQSSSFSLSFLLLKAT